MRFQKYQDTCGRGLSTHNRILASKMENLYNEKTFSLAPLTMKRWINHHEGKKADMLQKSYNVKIPKVVAKTNY